MSNLEQYIPKKTEKIETGQDIKKTPEFLRVEALNQAKITQLETATNLALFDLQNPIIKNIKNIPEIGFA